MQYMFRDSKYRIYIQSEYRKVRTRNDSVFGHFSAVSLTKSQSKFDILSIEMKQTERDNYCICLDSRRLRVYTSPQLMKMIRHYLSLMQQKIAV